MGVKRGFSGYDRLSFFPGDAPLPRGLSNVGWLSNRETRSLQPKHAHPDALELLYVAKGKMVLVVDGETCVAYRGTLIVVKAGQAHGGAGKQIYPSEVFWLNADLRTCREDFGPDFAAPAARLENLEERCFSVSAAVPEMFREILRESQAAGGYSEALIAARLKILLTAAARDGQAFLERRQLADPVGVRKIQETVAWIRANLEQNWTVRDLVERTRLKPSRFYRLFLRTAGFSPVEYRNRERVERAKEALRGSDAAITEIAFGLGFCSTQYFAVIFKKYEGAVPTLYRRRSRRGKTAAGLICGSG